MREDQSTDRTIVVIPTLNEARHIGRVVQGFLKDPAADHIWITDGGSRDGTRRIIRALEAKHSRVRLIHNARGLQAPGINQAARKAARHGARIMVRADAHAHYPPGFVSALVARLQDSGADSVTVPLVTPSQGASSTEALRLNGWQKAGAALQNSFLGHGGAAHRKISPSGWVTHGHHAAFRLDRFLALQGYDTSFAANEDVEFDRRLLRAGGSIWFDASLPVTYLPRPSLKASFAQMRRNGRGRAQTALKHGEMPGLRQMLPVIALSCLALMPLGLLAAPLALPGLAYLGLLSALAFLSAPLRPLRALRVALLALASHTGFAFGLIGGVLQGPLQGRGPMAHMLRLRPASTGRPERTPG